MNLHTKEIWIEWDSWDKNLSNYSSHLAEVFKLDDTNKSNNLTEDVIINLQKFLMYHKGVVTIEITMETSRENINVLTNGIEWLLEAQWISLIDHQNWFVTIETDISESSTEVEILGNTLRKFIWLDWLQVNIVSDIYTIKKTFKNLQEIEDMIYN